MGSDMQCRSEEVRPRPQKHQGFKSLRFSPSSNSSLKKGFAREESFQGTYLFKSQISATESPDGAWQKSGRSLSSFLELLNAVRRGEASHALNLCSQVTSKHTEDPLVHATSVL